MLFVEPHPKIDCNETYSKSEETVSTLLETGLLKKDTVPTHPSVSTLLETGLLKKDTVPTLPSVSTLLETGLLKKGYGTHSSFR